MLWVSRRHHCQAKKKVQPASWRKPDSQTGNGQKMVKPDFEIWFGHMGSDWRPSLQSCLLCWQRFQTKRSHQVQTWIGVKGDRVTSWSTQKRFGLVMVVFKRVAQLCSVEHLLMNVPENFWEHFEQLWGGDAFPGEVGTSEEECSQKMLEASHSTALMGIRQLLVFHQLIELGKDFDECPPRSPKGAGNFISSFV